MCFRIGFPSYYEKEQEPIETELRFTELTSELQDCLSPHLRGNCKDKEVARLAPAHLFLRAGLLAHPLNVGSPALSSATSPSNGNCHMKPWGSPRGQSSYEQGHSPSDHREPRPGDCVTSATSCDRNKTGADTRQNHQGFSHNKSQK